MDCKHKNLQAVKSKNSRIELMLRRELWARGVRYRKNVKKVYGSPDIAFVGKRIAVFCDGELWHGYDWPKSQAKFKSNRDFWISKIERNIKRDKEVNEYLESRGWIVLRFWGEDIKRDVSKCADIIEDALRQRS